MNTTNIEHLVRKLIDPVIGRRGSGSIECRDADGCLFIRLTPAPGDMGRLIGKGGANFETLKTVLEYVAVRYDRRLRLLIIEPPIGSPPAPRSPAGDWKPDEIVAIIRAFLQLVADGDDAATDCEAFAEVGGRWRIETSAVLPGEVGEALRRWVSIMAIATGGAALFNYESVAL